MKKDKKSLSYENQLKEMGAYIRELSTKTLFDKKRNIIRDYSPLLMDIDYQQFMSRYKWYGLPSYLPEGIIERILYYRGMLCGYFENDELKIYPFAISGKLNPYGYPTKIQPIAQNGDAIRSKMLNTYPNGELNTHAEACLLFDRMPNYNNGVCQPRISLVTDLIDALNDGYKRAEINLINSTKKIGITVENQAQANASIQSAIESLNDESPIIAVQNKDQLDLNRVFNTNVNNETEQITKYIASLNNLRCYSMGVLNTGLFIKQERSLVGEISGTKYQTDIILETGLTIRNNFINNLKELYPQYIDVLNNIRVEINKPTEENNERNAISNISQ